jgi:hypothetical protein
MVFNGSFPNIDVKDIHPHAPTKKKYILGGDLN